MSGTFHGKKTYKFMTRKVPLKFHPDKEGGSEENFKELQGVLAVLKDYQNNKNLDVNALMATLKRSKNTNPQNKKLKLFEKILEKYSPGNIPNYDGLNRIAKAYKKLSEEQHSSNQRPKPQAKRYKQSQPPRAERQGSGPQSSSRRESNVPPQMTPKQEMDAESDPRVRAEYSAAIRLAEKFNELYETYRNEAPFLAKSIAWNPMKFPGYQGLHKKPPKYNKYAYQLYGDLPNFGRLMGSDLVGMLRDRRIAPGRVTPKRPYVYFDTLYDPATDTYSFRAKVSTMHSNYLLYNKAYNNYIWATGRRYFKGSFMEFPIKHTVKSMTIGDDVVKITEDFYQKFKVIVSDSIKKDAAAKKRYEKQQRKEDEDYRRQDADDKANKAEKERKDADDAKKAAEKAANNFAKEAKKAANSDKKSKEELLKQLELLMRERASLKARLDELDRTFRDTAGPLRMIQNEAKSSIERLELQIANLRKEIETFNSKKKAEIDNRKQTAMLAAKRLREATESLEKASEMFRTNMRNITEKIAQNDKDIQTVKQKLAEFNKPNSPKPAYTKAQGKQKQTPSGEGSSGTKNNTPKPQKPKKNINKNKAKANSNFHKGDWVSKYNVEELKYILKALKLLSSGTKPVLQKRIRDGKYTQAYIEQIRKPSKK